MKIIRYDGGPHNRLTQMIFVPNILSCFLRYIEESPSGNIFTPLSLQKEFMSSCRHEGIASARTFMWNDAEYVKDCAVSALVRYHLLHPILLIREGGDTYKRI